MYTIRYINSSIGMIEFIANLVATDGFRAGETEAEIMRRLPRSRANQINAKLRTGDLVACAHIAIDYLHHDVALGNLTLCLMTYTASIRVVQCSC
jgi:hypothetical protein